jgi:hypothetical protein
VVGTPRSVLLDHVRTVIFGNVNAQGELELRAFDAVRKTSSRVRTIESDPDRAAGTYLQRLTWSILPDDRVSLIDNVSAADDARGGVRLSVFDIGLQGLDLTPFAGPEVVVAQLPEAEVRDYSVRAFEGVLTVLFNRHNFTDGLTTPGASQATVESTGDVEIILFGAGDLLGTEGFTFYF